MRLFVHDDRADFRRLHRVDHELRGVVVERNDVDALAGDLVRDGLDARTPHADAGADRIDARIVAADRDLGACARIACGTEDVDQALAHLRHLELEQLDQELRRGAAQEQLRTARLGTHVLQEGLDAVLRADRLARDHLVARDEAFGVAAEVDEDTVAVDALHQAGDQRADAGFVEFDDLRAFCLAHFLHDDLLRGLRRDAAERNRLERHFDVTTRLGFRRDVEGVLEAQLLVRELEFGRVVGKDLPALERVVVTRLAVDRNAHVDFFAVLLARGGRERGFECLEDDVLLDALLVRDGIHDHQDLFVHRSSSSESSAVRKRARGAPS